MLRPERRADHPTESRSAPYVQFVALLVLLAAVLYGLPTLETMLR